ncbi:MAG: V-type ATPase 116kDa subunit family protein [Candidatus Hydrogenedentes bacterium]|nr:V-type ATPase 116kDa subunit family protein [Candidatus Hydrogenedentota bacterium]
MGIARMERLEIICLRGQLPGVTAHLQELGVMHLEEVALAVEEAPEYLNRVELSDDQKKESNAFEDLHRAAKEVLPLLSIKASAQDINAAAAVLGQKSDHDLERLVAARAREIRSLTRRKLNALDNIELLEQFQKVLENVVPLFGGRDVAFGKEARAIVLKGDVDTALARLEDRRRSELGAESKLIHQRIARNHIVAVITYPPQLNDQVGRILLEEHIAPVDPPDKRIVGAGSNQVINQIRESLESNRGQLATINTAIAAFSKQQGAEVTALALVLEDKLERFTIVNQFAQSNMIAVLNGWIPADEADALASRLEKEFAGNVTVSKLGVANVEVHQVPTLLRNKGIFKHYEVLLSLFRPPTYGSFDPTVLVAVAFTLFYGFILGDMLYAVVVILFAKWLGRKFAHIEAVRSASHVGVYMGISGFIFGFLYMEFAGDLPQRLFDLQPIWIHRSHDIPTLMLYAILMGCIHVPLSLIIGFWTHWKHHHIAHALEKLALLIGLLSIGLIALNFLEVGFFAAPAFVYLGGAGLVICFVMLLYALGAMGLVMFLEVISLSGNVLSYCRLMALGLAGVIIADLANALGASLPWYIGIPAAAVIHVFNIGLSIFSPTLHSLRLNYVEFLPKFYQPEGRSYKPFKKEATW